MDWMTFDLYHLSKLVFGVFVDEDNMYVGVPREIYLIVGEVSNVEGGEWKERNVCKDVGSAGVVMHG